MGGTQLSSSKSSVPPLHHLLLEASVTVRGCGSPQDGWGGWCFSPALSLVARTLSRLAGVSSWAGALLDPVGSKTQARPRGAPTDTGGAAGEVSVTLGLREGAPRLPQVWGSLLSACPLSRKQKSLRKYRRIQAMGTRHQIIWGQQCHTSGTSSRMDHHIESHRWE